MAREVKRVAMDFDWPLEKVWHGYVNPHYKKCPHCEAGYSAAYKTVAQYINKLMWNRDRCSELDAITGFLAGRAPLLRLGHDSTDAWAAIKKLGQLAGLPDEWRTCRHCEGSGIDPQAKEAYEAWKSFDPPAGDGWQMWETTSEGSPISPVFATPEGLARWLADNGASSFGYSTATYEQWIKMIVGAGWAPSAVMEGGVMKSGVGFVAESKEDAE